MRHLSVLLAALVAAGPALAENRGVVIANARYQNAPELTEAEAGPASEAMKAAGFRTVAGADLAVRDVRQALADLLRPDDSPGARIVLLNGRFLHGGSDTWYMGTDADKPDLVGAGSQGVPLSMVLDLMKQAKPGAVLLLGSDDAGMEHAAGLENGIGPLTPPEGVTVISGPAVATAAAAAALLKPGTSVDDTMRADDRLTMAEGGDGQLVLVAATAESAGDPDATADPLESDRDLWAKAAAEDTAGAYRVYLDRYPSGIYSAAAQARLDALGTAQTDRDLWADAAAANTVAAYEDYLARYPSGEFAEAAQRRLSELRPAPAPVAPAPAPVQQREPEIQQPRQVTPPRQVSQAELTENRLNLSRADRVAIQRRLNTLGYSTGGADGIFGARSRSAIRGWQQSNGHAVTGYLTSAQVNAMRTQANNVAPSRDQQDRAYWQQTGAKGGVANLRAYLDRYPDGIYAQNARQRLAAADNNLSKDEREDRAWARARQTDTVQSYTQYLQNWPRGEHAEQASQRRTRLLNQGQLGNGGTGGIGGIGLDTIIRELVK
ncbi:peptidoglycan-binding domain-containing protein [Paracoccus sp. (in: a-proteobacteria)]|uniref:peptidoglycan-binding domain-containing protein n=1 Tax=Paracoccus sp. TaxID=267 RepID=UPI0028A75D0A|nr:peptidoglycan-binding domain-containing protein [Paracoccus sp. (in: a-proteobacteria)]